MTMNRTCLIASLFTSALFAQTPTPSGLWQFDGGLATQATIGANLVTTGPVSIVAGPTQSDSAVHIPKGSYFALNHGLGATVDEYSLQFDLRITDNTVYHTLFQTDPKNTTDAECFINRSGNVGITETIYAPTKLLPNQWYRVVIAVKNGERYDTYINGLKVQTGKPQAIGGRFALQSTLLISADNDGENADIDFAKVAIYNKALTDDEVSSIGEITIDKPNYKDVKTPQSFTQTTFWDGKSSWNGVASATMQTLTLNLVKYDNRASNYEILLQDDDGLYIEYNAGDIRTYLGTVKEYPDAFVAGILRRTDGVFQGKIYFDRGNTLFVTGSSITGSRGENSQYNFPSNSTLLPGMVNDTLFEYSMGLDLTYEYITAMRDRFTPSESIHIWEDTTTIESVVSRMELSMIQMSALYIYNANLIPKIGRAILRTSKISDPYEIANRTSPLSVVKEHWIAEQDDSERLAAAIILPSGGGGAWAPGIGKTWGYSVNGSSYDGSFDIVLRHEHGHNWGVGDNHSNRPEGATMMCGNQTGRFNGPGVQIIAKTTQSSNTRKYLSATGLFNAIQIPPYAAFDAYEINLDAQPTLINPITNDHDANNESLSLQNFQATTSKGGTVSRSSSDPNQLIYTRPAEGVLAVDSTDWFTYQVQDQNGKVATGVVMFKMLPKGTTVYQAEDAEFAGVTVDSKDAGYTGTGYIDMKSGKQNEYYLQYTIERAKTTLVNLNFKYTMGTTEDYKMLLTINNTIIDTLVFPKTSNWHTWTTLATQYTLDSGINTIRFTALSDETPNMDALVIWNVDGSGNDDSSEYIPTTLTAQKTVQTSIAQVYQVQGGIQIHAIQNQNPIEASLFSIQGKHLESQVGKSMLTLSTQGLPSGIYLYQLKQGDQIQYGKLSL